METEKLFEEVKSIAASKNEDIISKLISRLESEPKICVTCKSKIHRIKQKIDGAKIKVEHTKIKHEQIENDTYKPPLRYWYKSTHPVPVSKRTICRQLVSKQGRLQELIIEFTNKLNEQTSFDKLRHADCFCDFQSNKELLDILIKYL